MNVAETILVFVGVPLAVVAVLALLIFLPGGRQRPRYKSGQPWPHEPVWYEPHPDGPRRWSPHGCGMRRIGPAADAGSRRSGGPLGGARGTW